MPFTLFFKFRPGESSYYKLLKDSQATAAAGPGVRRTGPAGPGPLAVSLPVNPGLLAGPTVTVNFSLRA
jgi:hypothetical protein